MLDFLKSLFAITEVDGIKFYRYKSFLKYLKQKAENEKLRKSRKGKNLYTFEIPWYQRGLVSDAKTALEGLGCFDYIVEDEVDVSAVKYWANRQLLKWKNIEWRS